MSPILSLHNIEKSFKVETYASNFEINGVLLQGSHPIAYESIKLKNAEK